MTRSIARRMILVLLPLYGLGLAVGYVRLPWAAIKSLADFNIVASSPAVTYSEKNVSRPQQWYLDRMLTESPEPVVPRVIVSVQWNALVVARVRSGHWVSGTGAERKDGLYLCFFGAWVPVYTFGHVMA